MSRTLSRTKVELFLQCPRCFWLDAVAGVRQPPGFPFNLNSAVDHLLKNEFDRYRGGMEVPPRLAREGHSYVPAAHPELSKWRHNFTDTALRPRSPDPTCGRILGGRPLHTPISDGPEKTS